MVKKKPVISAAAALGIGMIVFFFLFQTEEREVKKRMKAFASIASKKAEDSQLIVAGKSKKLSKFFDQTCQVEAPEYNVSKNYDQKLIYSIAFNILSRYSELTLSFVDLRMEIPEKGVAGIVSAARIIGKRKGSDEVLEENHERNCRLKKIKDEWFFVKVELVDVLEK